MLKWTPCDGSRHASCINWLTYNVEGHLPQNTSMSHTPTTNRRLAVFTTLELTCKRIQATVHADKQTNAHTHKLEWIYVVTKISVIHENKNAQAVLTNTQAQLRTYEKYGQIHANDKLLTQISKPYRIGDDYSLCGKWIQCQLTHKCKQVTPKWSSHSTTTHNAHKTNYNSQQTYKQ